MGPVEAMIGFLTSYFSEKAPTGAFSLNLASKKSSVGFSLYSRGSDGAMLSHDHSTQFNFVLQSLTLWREIMLNMPMLWCMADQDMISEPYRLANTGQGYHRLQSCPRVGSAMRKILSNVQKGVYSATLFKLELIFAASFQDGLGLVWFTWGIEMFQMR